MGGDGLALIKCIQLLREIYTIKILSLILLKKVDPGSEPNTKDHGYFQDSPVPFPISKDFTPESIFGVGATSWNYFLEHNNPHYFYGVPYMYTLFLAPKIVSLIICTTIKIFPTPYYSIFNPSENNQVHICTFLVPGKTIKSIKEI